MICMQIFKSSDAQRSWASKFKQQAQPQESVHIPIFQPAGKYAAEQYRARRGICSIDAHENVEPAAVCVVTGMMLLKRVWQFPDKKREQQVIVPEADHHQKAAYSCLRCSRSVESAAYCMALPGLMSMQHMSLLLSHRVCSLCRKLIDWNCSC